MRLVIFFVCLFLLLIGGYTYIYTGTHPHKTTQHTAKHIVKPQQQKFTNTQQGYITSAAGSEKEEEYLIGDNIEDEDTDNLSARKYRLLARGHLPVSPGLSFLYSYSRASWPCYSLLSYKYITQGALRI